MKRMKSSTNVVSTTRQELFYDVDHKERLIQLLLVSKARFVFYQNGCLDLEIILDSKSKLPRDLYPLCVTADCRFVVDEANRMPDPDTTYLVHDLLVEDEKLEQLFAVLYRGWNELVAVMADGYVY